MDENVLDLRLRVGSHLTASLLGVGDVRLLEGYCDDERSRKALLITIFITEAHGNDAVNLWWRTGQVKLANMSPLLAFRANYANPAILRAAMEFIDQGTIKRRFPKGPE